MKTAFALIAIVGLAASAAALFDPPAGTATPPPPTGTPAVVPPPAMPPVPKSIPVPDLPIVNKQELEGGLIIEDMKIGEGREVKAGDFVSALYHGTRKSDGGKFDSAYERGAPTEFSLNFVIDGWKMGVPGMKPGGIRKLTIPAALGYGAQDKGADLPPNSDLVFVIQLVDSLWFEDITVGTGEEATNPCVPVTVHTIKGKDGKEIEKADAAKPYVWLPGEIMKSMGTGPIDPVQECIAGMKVGGKRKIHIPATFNVPSPMLPAGRTANVDLDIELELVTLRNLPRQPGR